jgi:hypothetical protein
VSTIQLACCASVLAVLTKSFRARRAPTLSSIEEDGLFNRKINLDTSVFIGFASICTSLLGFFH